MVVLVTKLCQAVVKFCSRLEESFLKQRKRELKLDVSDRDELREGSSRGRRRYCESYRATVVESKSKNTLEVSEIEPLSKEAFFSLLIYSYTHTYFSS